MITKYFVLLIVTVFINGCSSSADVGKSGNVSDGVPATDASSNREQKVNPVMPGNPGGNVAPPSDGRPVLHFEPAPENSQIAQATNKSGQMYELRIWKGHPQLLKVEANSIDNNKKALTIVLRNTKVFNVTTDRIPNVKLATAKQFLELADVESSPAPPDSKIGKKKAE